MSAHGTPIATCTDAMLLQKIVSLAISAFVALAAFLSTRAIGALVDCNALQPSAIAPFADARAAAAASSQWVLTDAAGSIRHPNRLTVRFVRSAKPTIVD